MSDEHVFGELIRRLRSGDPQAAEQLVREYEPAIRLEIRFHLRDARLRRAFDSMDVCQSVLASFFVRAAAGQFDLDDPSQLRSLLMDMARKKLASQVRKQQAQCRDVRRIETIDRDTCPAVASDPSPNRLCEARELLDRCYERLTPDERRLVDLRAQGWEWPRIAEAVGGTPSGRRKQLTHAVNRIALELGLEEHDEE